MLDFSSTWIGLDGFRTAGFPSVSVLLIDSSIVENYAIICWSILCWIELAAGHLVITRCRM